MRWNESDAVADSSHFAKIVPSPRRGCSLIPGACALTPGNCGEPPPEVGGEARVAKPQLGRGLAV